MMGTAVLRVSSSLIGESPDARNRISGKAGLAFTSR